MTALADNTQAQESWQDGPSPDFDEFSISTGDVDVSSIGGYPVRDVKVVSGSGTLKVKTAGSGTSYRTATLAVGDTLGDPVQIISIAGTTNGTSGITKIRVFK